MPPKRLSAASRKKQIAFVAASLFAKKGFNGVTTREIAKKAKVNEALIFRFFPTKDALYTEIINQKVHIVPEAFDLEAAKTGKDEEVFRSVAKHLIKQVEEDNTFLRLMLYSALEGHSLSSLFLKNRTHILFNFLNSYISKRIGSGAFRKIEPVVAVRAFIGMFFHFIIIHELFRIPKLLRLSNDDAVNGFVNIYLNGLRKK